jgi:hypothetical protein
VEVVGRLPLPSGALEVLGQLREVAIDGELELESLQYLTAEEACAFVNEFL